MIETTYRTLDGAEIDEDAAVVAVLSVSGVVEGGHSTDYLDGAGLPRVWHGTLGELVALLPAWRDRARAVGHGNLTDDDGHSPDPADLPPTDLTVCLWTEAGEYAADSPEGAVTLDEPADPSRVTLYGWPDRYTWWEYLSPERLMGLYTVAEYRASHPDCTGDLADAMGDPLPDDAEIAVCGPEFCVGHDTGNATWMPLY